VGTAQAAPAAPCPWSGYRYSAVGTSGYGSNKGTGAWQNTWNNWSLNGHPQGDEPWSNEAVWTLDYNDNSNSLEVGFNTGAGANANIFSNSMYPYYTTNNGGTEKDYTGTALPKNTTIWNSATSDGTSSWAYVNNKLLAKISYGVRAADKVFPLFKRCLWGGRWAAAGPARLRAGSGLPFRGPEGMRVPGGLVTDRNLGAAGAGWPAVTDRD
jgi:hypothetical protein